MKPTICNNFIPRIGNSSVTYCFLCGIEKTLHQSIKTNNMKTGINIIEKDGNINQYFINWSSYLNEIVDNIQYMQDLYATQRYTKADEMKARILKYLDDKLDDIMVLGETN